MSRTRTRRSGGGLCWPRRSRSTVPGEAQGWPLLKWCQVVAAPAAVVESYVADTDTQVGWRPLLDPSICPADALPFLGQFVGAQVPVGSDEVTARAIVT